MVGTGKSSPLVGRVREQSELEHCAREAVAGRGGAVLVCGEAGVGKTALVDAALAEVELLAAHAAASPVATPVLGPVTSLLRALHRDDSELNPIETFAAFARERPLVLVLDDLQWADHATLELLPDLANTACKASLLVVGIYRNDAIARGHPIRAMREALRRARALREISLAPLHRDDSLALFAQRLGRPPSEALGAAVFERSGGVPFYVEAMADALRERATDALPLPDTVRDAVLARTDVLSLDAREVAEAAAVVGTELPLELLVTLNGGDAGIEALLESGIVAERRLGFASFRTPLARDAIYAAIPWTRRRTLHKRVAETLEAGSGSPEQVAEHWLAAGEPERARRALLDGARRSRELHAHRDTVHLLRGALDLWPAGHEEAERLAALDQLGDAAQVAGLFPDAMRAWREVAESGKGEAHGLALARALRKIANLHELSCDWPKALEARQDAMRAFAAAGDPAEAAVDGIGAAIRLRQSGGHTAALEVLVGAAAYAEASQRDDLKIRVASLKGNLEARLGRYVEGIAAIRAARDAALALNDTAIVGEAYRWLVDAIERSSDFRAAVTTNREGVAFCEERGAAGAAVTCLACMTWILVRGGEWEQATIACRQVLESPARNPVTQMIGLGVMGLLHMLRGEQKKGEALLVEADAAARRLEHAIMELVCRWGFAIRDAMANDQAAAAQRCRGILARWRSTDERHAAMPILRWAASCFAAVGDREGLQACADAFGENAAVFSHAEPLSALAHVLGEMAWLDGDVARAVQQFEHAVVLLEDMQLPRERIESQLRAAAACAAAGQREKAVAHAREAARAAERLGARPLCDAAARQLRLLGEPLAGAIGPRGARRAEHGGLTARQLQVLGEISNGLSDKEIGRALRLSPRTVEMHVARALAALDCRTRAEAVRKAGELGVLGSRVP